MNFQNALILSFRKLFQCFQKIWKANTALLPKREFIFQKLPFGSQNWLSNLDLKPLPNSPPYRKFRFLEIARNVGGVGKVWLVEMIISYVVEFSWPGIRGKVHQQPHIWFWKSKFSEFETQNVIFITSDPNFSASGDRISFLTVNSSITMH